VFQPHVAGDVFVQVPAFDAQFALVDRVGLQRQRAYQFTVDDLKQDATAGATV
jgi:hypothetical protein